MSEKKNFTGVASTISPATQFISVPSETEPEKEEAVQVKHQPSRIPEGFRLNPKFVEKRSKRFQMLMTPTLLEAVKARAKEVGISANSLIHELLEREYLEKSE